MPTAPDATSLVDDLIYLRKGVGCTPSRLATADAVFKMTGGPNTSPEAAMERLVACLRGMQDSKGGQALWAAFGFNEHGQGDGQSALTLKDRRAAYATQVGKAPYTVKEWEDHAVAELALRLLSGWFPSATTPADRVLPHGGLLIRSLQVVTVIRDGVFVESQQTRTVISLVDGATHFVYGTYSPTEVFNVTGGSATTEQHPGGTIHRITFEPTIPRGQQHHFSFRERVPQPPDDPAIPTSWTPAIAAPAQDFAGQTFESPTLLYRNEVVFLGDMPKVVWAYDKLSRIERPGQPMEHNTLSLGNGHTVAMEFRDLYGGLASGVGWRW